MPAKNATKLYVENGYYHLYNRGVEKRPIFLDSLDYNVFLSYMKQYLLPKNEKELYDRLSDTNISSRERDKILKLLRLNNFHGEIKLIAFCLMPNHFHLLVNQRSSTSIDTFMQSLCTRYTMYFNKRYKRVGPLYQGVYKAVLVEKENYYLHLTRYIHRQALTFQGETLEAKEKQPSSYGDYLKLRKTEWAFPDEVLSYFSKTNPKLSYKAFVESKDDFDLIEKLLIDGNAH